MLTYAQRNGCFCRKLRGEGVYVRIFSDPSLFPYPGGDQNRQPVFLRLSMQERTDEGLIRLKPKTGFQRDPHPAAQGLQGARSNLCLPPSCAGESDLADQHARELLLQYGYTPENLNACVLHLIRRLRTADEFPHEIGLFLSYPPEDVLGFIHNKACNHKCLGCWKVYGDEQKAKSTFEKYNLCSRIYFQQWQQGKSIEQLTVAG